MNYNTREEWLLVAVEELRAMFAGAGTPVPKVRVACGWPSSGGLGLKKRAIGECWDAASTEDNVAQIFISPLLNDPLEKQGVLSTLAHEMVHAAVGCKAKHGPQFYKLAKSIGLVPPWTRTVADEGLIERFKELVAKLGPYPHAPIISKRKTQEKQSTRLIKADCPKCGYTVRVTQKWIAVGSPHCPFHGVMTVHNEEQENEEQ